MLKIKINLKNMNIELSYNPAMPLLDIYTKELKAGRDLSRYLCTSVQNSIIHNSQKVETTQISEKWMYKMWISKIKWDITQPLKGRKFDIPYYIDET